MQIKWFLAGMGIGAVIVLLNAPRTGAEARAILSAKADEARRIAKRKIETAGDRVNEAIEQGKKVVARKSRDVAAAMNSAADTLAPEV